MTNLFTYINKALKLLSENEKSELSISTTFGVYLYIKKEKDNYKLKTICDFITDNLYSKKDLIKLLLKYEIICINVYGFINKLYIDEIIYNFQYKYANIIQKGYRKYRLRTARIRNDIVIHGFSKYWGHPSRIDFNF